jgi:hypothetical protein
MQELRFVAVSEDGSYAVLAVPGRSARFTLPIDERLRAVALGQTSRLAQYEIEVESPLRPKEIQARIRAGETAEEIADAAGIPVERVRWFEGPVLAERGYIAEQAQAASVRRPGESPAPGPRLRDIVPTRLKGAGADPDEGQWDSRKRGDGNWQVTLTFTSGGRLHVAEWMFDPRRRHVMPEDDTAGRLSLPDTELAPLSVPVPGEATVTPLAPRLGAAAVGGMGGPGMSSGGSAGGRFRAERPAPERPAVPERPSASAGTSPDDPERARPTPKRPLVFEEPDPAPFEVQPPIEPAPFDVQPPPEPAPARDQPAAARQEPVTADADNAEPAAEPVPEPAAVASAGSAEGAGPAAGDQPARPPTGKKSARGRRSSVPSWDEVMLGSSRQHD